MVTVEFSMTALEEFVALLNEAAAGKVSFSLYQLAPLRYSISGYRNAGA